MENPSLLDNTPDKWGNTQAASKIDAYLRRARSDNDMAQKIANAMSGQSNNSSQDQVSLLAYLVGAVILFGLTALIIMSVQK